MDRGRGCCVDRGRGPYLPRVAGPPRPFEPRPSRTPQLLCGSGPLLDPPGSVRTAAARSSSAGSRLSGRAFRVRSITTLECAYPCMRDVDVQDLSRFLSELQTETDRGLALVGASVLTTSSDGRSPPFLSTVQQRNDCSTPVMLLWAPSRLGRTLAWRSASSIVGSTRRLRWSGRSGTTSPTACTALTSIPNQSVGFAQIFGLLSPRVQDTQHTRDSALSTRSFPSPRACTTDPSG